MTLSNWVCCIFKGYLFRLQRDHNRLHCAMWQKKKSLLAHQHNVVIFITTILEGYYIIPASVCPSAQMSVLPSEHPILSITWVFVQAISLNFAYIFISGMSDFGLLVVKIHQFLPELQPFLVSIKGFLACNFFIEYVDGT